MKKYNKLIRGIGVFLLYILVPEILNMFLPSLTSSNWRELLCRFMFMFLLLLLFCYIYREDLIKDIKTFKKNALKNIGKAFFYSFLIIIGLALISTIIYKIYPDFGYTNSNIIRSLFSKSFILMLFYVFGITLLTEQIVFRKVFKDILQNKYFFIIFSSLIYGIFQIGYNITGINDLLSIIPFAYTGIILSVSYEKSNTIVMPCLVYLIYDLLQLIML